MPTAPDTILTALTILFAAYLAHLARRTPED